MKGSRRVNVDRLEHRADVDALADLVQAEPQVRRRAIEALRRLDTPRALRAVARFALQPSDFDVVIQHLGDRARRGDGTALEELVALLEEDMDAPSHAQGPPRRQTLEALFVDLGETVVPSLVATLDCAVSAKTDALTFLDELRPAKVVSSVSRILGQIGDRRGVAPLINALEAWPDMGHEIAPNLAALGDGSALGPLRDLAEGGNLHPRQAGLVALGRLGGADEITYLLEWVHDANPQYLDAAFGALAAAGDDAIDTLLSLMADGGGPALTWSWGDKAARATIQPWRRRLAAWALGETRNERAVEPLCMVALDEDVDYKLRVAAIRALARIHSPRAAACAWQLVQANEDRGASSELWRAASLTHSILSGELAAATVPDQFRAPGQWE